jgi:phosphoribosyl 1,2-cyclic phosphodiesterase
VKVSILGSGSRGNAIVVGSGKRTVLIDAGFPFRTLKRRAESAGLDLSTITAVILTHEHNDHACAAMQVAVKAGCPVYASVGTIRGLGPGDKRVEIQEIAHRESVEVGPFTVGACRVSHDARDPMALAVIGPRCERLAIAYDLGRANPLVQALLRSADCVIVESNHDEGMLLSSPYPVSVQRRISGPSGHLSNRAAADLLFRCYHASLQTVVLAHVSEVCNQKTLARQVSREALKRRGYGGRLLVAEQDHPMETFEVRPSSSSEQLRLL